MDCDTAPASGLSDIKSNFVSIASHELRTPLAVMQSIAELLELQVKQGHTPDAAVLIQNVSQLKSEISRMNNLIDEILTISKIENANIKPLKEKVDVIAFIQQIIERNNALQTDHREIVFIHEDNPIYAHVDKQMLVHILDNLISNALKYSIGKPAPELTCRVNNNQFTITIKDFGIGIPRHQQKNIFQTFFRAENTASIKGSGLGLFIAKSFTELHNGTVSFNSAENKGSVFTICLPTE